MKHNGLKQGTPEGTSCLPQNNNGIGPRQRREKEKEKLYSV